MEGERERRIRERAYALWQEGGGQDGDAEAHWLRAEREVGESSAARAGSESPDVAASVATGAPASAKTSRSRSAAPVGAASGPARASTPKPKAPAGPKPKR